MTITIDITDEFLAKVIKENGGVNVTIDDIKKRLGYLYEANIFDDVNCLLEC
jgi:hypothetical protein